MGQQINELLTKFPNGDSEAFTTLYNEYYGPLSLFCRKIVPREEAEDIIADVFIRLWKSRNELNTIINVKAFLFASARNACVDYLRAQKSKPAREKQLALIMENGNDLFMTELIKAELFNEIYRQIQTLPENCRRVFTLSYIDGYKNAEIAEILGISEKTVRNSKYEALKILKNFFSCNQLTALLICPFLKEVFTRE